MSNRRIRCNRDHVTPAVEAACGVRLPADRAAVDGCGVPVWAMPLDRVAAGWAGLVGDAAGRRLLDAMVAEPVMVAGAGRVDTRLLADGGGRLVAKTGAEGVHAAVDLIEGRAVALKARDGATRAAEAAIEWVLGVLGTMAMPAPQPLRNAAGTVVGSITVAG
ncbi:MAG: asparaginase [Acidimicrobiales bacterium]